jgi:hypothetical protein
VEPDSSGCTSSGGLDFADLLGIAAVLLVGYIIYDSVKPKPSPVVNPPTVQFEKPVEGDVVDMSGWNMSNSVPLFRTQAQVEAEGDWDMRQAEAQDWLANNAGPHRIWLSTTDELFYDYMHTPILSNFLPGVDVMTITEDSLNAITAAIDPDLLPHTVNYDPTAGRHYYSNEQMTSGEAYQKILEDARDQASDNLKDFLKDSVKELLPMKGNVINFLASGL